MNIREFKKIISPILKASPDLAFSRGSVFVTPIRHTLRAISFHPTSWPTGFQLTVTTGTICGRTGKYPLGFGGVKAYWPKHNYWESDEPDFLESLFEAIEVECLPKLRAADNFEKLQALHEWYHDPTDAHFQSSMAFFHLMAGRFEEVDEILTERTAFVQREFLVKFIPEVAEKKPHTCARLSKKRKREILQHLHEREATAIRNFRLEKYWEPSPFPAEEQGVV